MDVRAILHPVHSPGLPTALTAIDGLQLVRPSDDEGVVAALREGAEVLVTFRWRDEFQSPSLRWVHAISAGHDQFPADSFAERGIVLTSSRGAHTPAVAEHAIALLMGLTRGLGIATRRAATGTWAPIDVGGDEVGGRVLGILGLGSIGEAVARLAVGLGMSVIGTKRDPRRYDGVARDVLPDTRTLEVFRRADAVVIALPRTQETRRLVGAAELEALGGGWLVNVGRGEVIDEAALIEALQCGHVRGAGLDVFEEEPLPADSPLWSLENVLLTPHSAWFTPRLEDRLAAVLRANLEAWRGRAPWRNREV